MCGPKDMAIANTVSSVKMPGGADAHTRAVVLARGEITRRTTARATAIDSARSKLVIFTNDWWSDHPNSTATAMSEESATPATIARLKPRPTNSRLVSAGVVRATRHDANTAIAASTAVVNPGKSHP